ncbi:MAG: ADP-ribosylglycohydrolase family protein [Deltaproteobacteria bacterium]|nr:ADP-ribosylglycohydrolase family protein [Deltaproteobacteria bacterium]
MSLPADLAPCLAVATQAAAAAAQLIRDARATMTPSDHGSHLDCDDAAEHLIRARLLDAFPAFGYLGEETGGVSRPGAPVWVVDPNDGTHALVRGERGSAVSIALVWQGLPVLGVVHAVCAPDDAGDALAWAEGCGPMTRNGQPVARDATEVPSVVLGAWSSVKGMHKAVAPLRVRVLPSVAYRLALVAAGDAVATFTTYYPAAWDIAGGHALLRGAGGDLFRSDGRPVRYGPDGSGSVDACAGCLPADKDRALAILRGLENHGPRSLELGPFAPVKPWPQCDDAGRLARAHGCLLGQLTGDSLGGLVEFRGPSSIAAEYPDGPRRLKDGGSWNLRAGQPTDDSEMALCLARTLCRDGAFDADQVARGYRAWYDSPPFDIGRTTATALQYATGDHPAERATTHGDHQSQANGSLMRCSPLGIFCAGRPLDQTVQWARQDARITHPHTACQEATSLLVATIAHAIGSGGDRSEVFAFAQAQSRMLCGPQVQAVVDRCASPPADVTRQAGWFEHALQLAFYHLRGTASFEDALVDTVRRGGDTDTNAAIVGALLGAVLGREAIPLQWRAMVLTCRAEAALGAAHPRPAWLWPIDALEVAEQLLVVGRG